MAYETPIVYNLDSGSGNGGGGCGNSMWGGDGSWIFAFLIIALIFGDRWGNNGNNGGNNGGGTVPTYIPYPTASIGGFNASGALTRADLCQDMNFQSVENGVRGIQQGLCDGFYAMNTSLLNGFHGVDNALCTLGNSMMQGFSAANVTALQGQNAIQTQLAQCCCENREGQAQIRYDMATNTCALQNTMNTNTRDVIDSQNAGTRAILDKMCQMEYNALNDKYQAVLTENQGLKFNASQSAQNQYLISQLRPFPVAAYQVCNPFTGTYGGYQGYGSGCACNTGCGC